MPELAKAYEPKPVESKWYQTWLDQQLFTADPARVSAKRPAYSIVIPPPNVTGVLTLGHVLNNTIQDILARKARMDGKEVLWLPGTDHAGIATQTVVERTLKKQGVMRHRDDLGREKFLEKVWEWREKHGGIILQQLRALGASCDWTRTRFTMDPDYVRCVEQVFVDLYHKGHIYRGKRMVNWCPASLTALSDEEVIMKEQKGSLYYFKVEVAERAGTFLTIATTRPETIPGDTAVAVNPKDPRYASFIGLHVLRPLPAEFPREKKLLPIIGDEHVDFEFGTGVLKVTPAHDKADFEIGQRHHLPQVDIMNPDATMNELAGEDLKGLDRTKARHVAAEKLAALGVLEKQEPYTNKVGFSERANVPIEPRLSEQWFLKYPSAAAARALVADGRMKFFPERWAKVYDHWMGNIQDWCISRQLWWGHRIPVWRKVAALRGQHELAAHLPAALFERVKQGSTEFQFLSGPGAPASSLSWRSNPDGEVSVGSTNVLRIEQRERESTTSAVTGEAAPEFAIVCCTIEPALIEQLEAAGFTRDPDVLDTWFSSWLWPFATMGWMGEKRTDGQNATLRTFYPTTDLVTGPDIIFFWVARMIMAGIEYMGELPFRNVYYTGIIRDKNSEKMSKSLGNSPDPLALISGYGADALRFGIMRSVPLGQDLIFEDREFDRYGKDRYEFDRIAWNSARFPQLELARNFCNKLWNACRFRQMQGGEVQGEIESHRLRSDDKWILLKLHLCIKALDAAFAEYKFNDATKTLYDFFWGDYCDYYVEATKPVFQGTDPAKKASTLAVMDFVLSHLLRLFHPFLPFITEELWHGMGYAADMPAEQGGRTIMQAPWPKPFDADMRDHYSLDDCYLDFVNAKLQLIGLGRNLRKESKIADNIKVKFILKPAQDLPPNDIEVIRSLLNAESFALEPEYQPRQGVASAHTSLGELYLPLEGLIDLEAELARLRKELEKIEAEITKVEQKLANPNFLKAPPNVVEEHRQRLADWLAKKAHVQKAIAGG